MEAWRPVVGYEGEYQVSNLGRVMSLKNNVPKLLRLQQNRRGYIQICLIDVLPTPKGEGFCFNGDAPEWVLLPLHMSRRPYSEHG